MRSVFVCSAAAAAVCAVSSCAGPPPDDAPATGPLISLFDVDDDRAVCTAGAEGYEGLATRDCALDVVEREDQRFVVVNPSDEELHITDVRFDDGGGFVLVDAADVDAIAAHGRADVVVSFDDSAGRDGVLRITSDAINDAVVAVTLRGRNVCSPRIAVVPAECDFGDVDVGGQAFCDLSINNLGACELLITDIAFTDGTPAPTVFGPEGAFPLPTTTPAGTGVTLRIYGHPQDETTSTGDLIITTNDIDAPEVRVPLRVNGVTP